MTNQIPDEAVDAALRAAYDELPHIPGTDDEQLYEDLAATIARKVLTTCAPLIAAQAVAALKIDGMDIAQWHDEAVDLKEQVRAGNERLASVQHKLVETEHNAKVFVGQRDDEHAAGTDARRRLIKLTEQMRDLEAELADVRKARDELRAEVHHLVRVNDNVIEQRDSMMETMKMFRADNANTNRRMDKLSVRVDMLEQSRGSTEVITNVSTPDMDLTLKVNGLDIEGWYKAAVAKELELSRISKDLDDANKKLSAYSVQSENVDNIAYHAFCEARKGRVLDDGEYQIIYSRVEAGWLKDVVATITPYIAQAVMDTL